MVDSLCINNTMELCITNSKKTLLGHVFYLSAMLYCLEPSITLLFINWAYFISVLKFGDNNSLSSSECNIKWEGRVWFISRCKDVVELKIQASRNVTGVNQQEVSPHSYSLCLMQDFLCFSFKAVLIIRPCLWCNNNNKQCSVGIFSQRHIYNRWLEVGCKMIYSTEAPE